jgi:glucosylglycerol-phosphate synthase
VFNVLPWREEILSSLLTCDYVGFHTERYCENFLDVARPHRVAVGAHPVGVDLERVHQSLTCPTYRSAYEALRADLAGLKVIVSAERFDYMKGPLQKLRAYERFLTLYPAWREKVTFIDICVPPAEGMAVYDEMRAQVEQAVGRINGRFSTTRWSPITFIFRQTPFETLAAYLSIADVAWITPLRDGLNLVAKEFVAIQSELDQTGVLVVSEFAGCSVELTSALLTNPYDVYEMAGTLHRALEMSPLERRERMRVLARVVRQHDVNHWAQSFIRAALPQPEWVRGVYQCAQ